MAKQILVPLADGFEEIEAMTIIDVLRRAGLEVTVAGLAKKETHGAHGVKVLADTTLGEVKGRNFDAVVLPGGMPGSERLAGSEDIKALVKRHAAAGKITAAICAAPWALGASGVLAGKKVTCYPGFEEKLTSALPQKDRVVVDGPIITSRGPGTALEFALKLVEVLVNSKMAGELRSGMLVAG